MTFDRNGLLFLLLCAIWGTTWIGIKAGIDVVPPLAFAGTRFMTAGAILLAVSAVNGSLRVALRDWPRFAVASLFMIALCYGPLFWGMLYVDSGTAAVAFSLHPVEVADLMAVADAGEIMPPKSTWFEPKLRDGLLIHLI